MFCPECGLQQPEGHRFCVACGTRLPRELIPPEPKLTQLFLGLPTHPSDPPEPVLRVSLYREEEEVVTADGSTRLVGQHARFSVWRDDRPTCAMSLGEDEARRLSTFIRDGLRHDQPEGSGLPGLDP
jgi:hypothetical protein